MCVYVIFFGGSGEALLGGTDISISKLASVRANPRSTFGLWQPLLRVRLACAVEVRVGGGVGDSVAHVEGGRDGTLCANGVVVSIGGGVLPLLDLLCVSNSDVPPETCTKSCQLHTSSSDALCCIYMHVHTRIRAHT